MPRVGRSVWFRRICGICGLILVLSGLGLAQPGWQEPFQFSFVAGPQKAPGEQTGTITALIPAEFLLYKDQISFALSSGTLISTFPPHHTKDDPLGGGKMDVFDGGSHAFGLTFVGIPAGGATVTIEYQGCSSQTCFMPANKAFFIAGEGSPQSGAGALPGANVGSATPSASTGTQPAIAAPPATGNVAPVSAVAPVVAVESSGTVNSPVPSPLAASPVAANPVAVSTPSGRTDFARSIQEHGLLWALVLAFFGGLLVSFTPCVYPMIPITLSIIGGRTENRTAGRGFLLSVTYVAGLSLTYALLGLAVSFFGAHIRGILQGPVFQTGVALLFVLLALSMFDVFMLEVPSALRNRLAGMRTTGLFGIFVMGMVSGLMASPCVAAPLAGILAFIAASGNSLLGFLLLLSFAWGMGLILIVIGTFSGSLNALPRAGEWMERVKEFYGFMLLGAALYFVQPLLGAAVQNLLVALLLASFAAFLGVFQSTAAGAPLFSRVLKCWGILSLSVAVAFAVTAAATWGGLGLPPTVGDKTVAAPETLLLWHDSIEAALSKAQTQGRPVFVDFRADWCVICRELEERVFPDPAVQACLGKMVLVKFDATHSTPEVTAVLKKYQVIGLPTLMMLNPDGTERADLRVVGDISAAQLAQTLKQLLKP